MSPYPLPPRDLMLLSHYGAAIYTVNSNNNNNAVLGTHIVPPITTVPELLTMCFFTWWGLRDIKEDRAVMRFRVAKGTVKGCLVSTKLARS